MDYESNEDTEVMRKREKQFNFWGSIGLCLFASVFLIAAFQIKTITTAKWYEAPKFFPVIIGSLLLIFCIVYLVQNLAGVKITAEDRSRLAAYLKSPVCIRLLVSVGLLALYVFVLLGLRIGRFKLPYEAATFIYLCANMLVFRTKKYAIWKIILISILVAIVVGLCFGKAAKIPLP
jgi:hypothetical protein